MLKTNAKKLFAALTISSLALIALLALALMSSSSASAKTELSPPNTSTSMAASSSALSAAAQTTGIIMPRTPVYALDTDNTFFVLVPGTTTFVRLFRVAHAPGDGNSVEIDFRGAAVHNT